MKMFGNLSTEGLEETGDRLGGGGILDAGGYTGTVKLAYVGKSSKTDAQSITVLVDVKGFEYRETFWITNRNGENFYADKKDPKKKMPLPGFTQVDDLCLLTTGFPLAQQDIEEKVVNLYDFDAKKEVPQNVPVLVDLIGKEIAMGVLRETVDKTKLNESTGSYDPTGETRDQNVVDKFFHAESLRTVTEVRQDIKEAVFYPKWVEKNAGKVRNRATGGQGKTGAPGAPAPSAAAKPKTSLFG